MSSDTNKSSAAVTSISYLENSSSDSSSADFFHKIKRSSIYTVLGRITEHISTLIVFWLLVKKLSLAEYGVYSLLLGTSSYLAIVSSFGLMPTFKRYLPEFSQKKEYKQFLWTTAFGLIFRFVAALLSILIIALLFDKIGPFFQIGEYYTYFLVFAVGIIFLLQAELMQRVLEAVFLHKYILFAHVMHVLVRLSLLFIIFSMGYGLLHVLAVEAIAYLLLMILCFFFYRQKIVSKMQGKKQNNDFSKSDLLRRLFRYSGFSLFNNVGKIFIDMATGFFVVSHYLGPAALGYYAFSAKIGRLISKMLPSKIMSTVIAPTFFTRYAESDDKKELNRMFHFLAKLNAFLLFPVFTLVAIFGRDIIQHVFDPKYLAGYPVMIVLLIFYMMPAFPLALPLQAVEKPEMVLIGKLASVYNLIMAIILVQIWGIMGVAIASSSAIVLKKLFEYAMSKRYAGITFPWIGMSKILINCLIIGAFGIWARQFVDSVFSLIGIFMLAAATYLFISFFNKVFHDDERNLINKMIGKPYFVF